MNHDPEIRAEAKLAFASQCLNDAVKRLDEHEGSLQAARTELSNGQDAWERQKQGLVNRVMELEGQKRTQLRMEKEVAQEHYDAVKQEVAAERAKAELRAKGIAV